MHNQLQCYAVLEKYGIENSLFRTTPNLPRAEHLHYDYKALWTSEELPTVTQSTKNYIEHIESIKEEVVVETKQQFLIGKTSNDNETNNPFAINLYLLGYDGNGKLTNLNQAVKENLKTYLNELIVLNLLQTYLKK